MNLPTIAHAPGLNKSGNTLENFEETPPIYLRAANLFLNARTGYHDQLRVKPLLSLYVLKLGLFRIYKMDMRNAVIEQTKCVTTTCNHVIMVDFIRINDVNRLVSSQGARNKALRVWFPMKGNSFRASRKK